MKELKMYDKKGEGFITIDYSNIDPLYQICLEIQKSIFNIHTSFSLPQKDVHLLILKLSDFRQDKQEEMEWMCNGKETHLAILLKKCNGNIEATLRIEDHNHICNMCMNFDYFTFDEIEFVEVEGFNYQLNENAEPSLYVNNTKKESDSLDFNLLFHDYFMDINKSFWLYNFEYDSFCELFAKYINYNNAFSMNVTDSFLWIDFKIINGNNYVVIDTYDLERDQSCAKVIVQIEQKKLKSVYQQFIGL